MLRFITILLFMLNFTSLLACEKKELKEGYHNLKLEFVKDNFLSIRAERSVTNDEHTNFLKEVLATAKETVMISTYTISPERILKDGLGQAIIDAEERGIAVYIYFENLLWCPKEDYADWREVMEHCTKFEQNANHSKCLMKDKQAVAIGSRDWLGKTYHNSSNATLIITGGLGFSLINDVWRSIRFYQSLEKGNEQGIAKFLNNIGAFTTGEYQFAPGQFYYTLQTPEAHKLLFDEALEKAERRVLLFSPFIRLQKLRETLNHTVLGKLQQKGITMKLITLPSPCDRVPNEQKTIFSDLNKLCKQYSIFSYVTHPNFHAKTLIAGNLICEGSHNLLSAVTELDHAANNLEMSVALRGDIAGELIKSFEQTDLGKFVLKLVEKPLPPLKMKPLNNFNSNQQLPYPSKISKKRDNSTQGRLFQNVQYKKHKITKIPASFDNIIKIFPGEEIGKKGYCVRFNGGDYLRDERKKIHYLETPEKAKKAAYKWWKKRKK